MPHADPGKGTHRPKNVRITGVDWGYDVGGGIMIGKTGMVLLTSGMKKVMLATAASAPSNSS